MWWGASQAFLSSAVGVIEDVIIKEEQAPQECRINVNYPTRNLFLSQLCSAQISDFRFLMRMISRTDRNAEFAGNKVLHLMWLDEHMGHGNQEQTRLVQL